MAGITHISWENAVDDGTCVANSQASTLPASNLKSPRFGRVWRSLSTTPTLEITFAQPTTIRALALAGCTLAAADTVRHQLITDLLVIAYDSGVIPCGVEEEYALHAKLLSQSYASIKYWVTYFSAPSRATDGYFDIARAWAGPCWTPEVGMSRPWGEGWSDGADIIRGKKSGGVFVGDGPKLRTLDFSLDWMGDADKALCKRMLRDIGRRKQLFVIPDEAGHIPTEAILGRIPDLAKITNSKDVVPPVYETSFSILQDP